VAINSLWHCVGGSQHQPYLILLTFGGNRGFQQHHASFVSFLKVSSRKEAVNSLTSLCLHFSVVFGGNRGPKQPLALFLSCHRKKKPSTAFDFIF